MAMLSGILRPRRNSPPAPATSERFTSGMPKVAVVDATTRSQDEHDLGAAGQGGTVDGGDDRLGALPLDDAGEAAPWPWPGRRRCRR